MENSTEHKLGEKGFIRQEALEWDRTAKSTFFVCLAALLSKALS